MLSPHGTREVGLAAAIAALLSAAVVWAGWWWLLVPVWLLWLGAVAFFRDPERPVPPDLDPDIMLSPADGRVSAIERVESHEATGGGPAVVIRIFLSILNVHVNRAPCDGRVVAITHRPGRYLDARTPESARLNESNLIALERWAAEGSEAACGLRLAACGLRAPQAPSRPPTPDPRPPTLGVRQVSGAVARRIICPLTPGQVLKRGERIGMIKFGSTTELILPNPDDVEVLVRVGQMVYGARTHLARVRSK